MKMFLDGIKAGKIKDSEEFIQVKDLGIGISEKFKFDPCEWDDKWDDKWESTVAQDSSKFK